MAEGRNGRDWAAGGGVAVILATGFAAFNDPSFLEGGGTVSVILAIAVVVITVGGAIALSRFIANHGDEIGEARFDTRNKDDREA